MITFHQTHHKIADFSNIFKYLKDICKNASGINLFPELFLTGYPLKDLCLYPEFITRYNEFLKDLEEFILNCKGDYILLVGGIDYKWVNDHWTLYNCVYSLRPGQKIENIYNKRLLPSYDIFDENKYFSPGSSEHILKWKDKKFGILICEDMWPNYHDNDNPVKDYKDKEIDAIFVFSASPYYINKDEVRKKQAENVSLYLEAPILFINRVGGEDEIIFDGTSFGLNGSKLFFEGKKFSQDIKKIDLPVFDGSFKEMNYLIRPQRKKITSITLKNKEKATLDALGFGLTEYTQKNNINKITIALSGGIDSSLVLVLCKKYFI